MVVYRDGYQPPDDPSIIRPPSGAIIGTKKVKSKSQESTPFIPQPIGSLTKVNQVKRDRRTIEEVQAELKKRKTETENYSEK